MSEQTSAFDATAAANDLVNGWLSETQGVPITLQLSRLGIRIVQGLEAAYKAGQEQAIAYFTEHKDDGGDLLDDEVEPGFDDMEFFGDDEDQ